MHPIAEFRNFFVRDLLKRAKNCLELSAKKPDEAILKLTDMRTSDEIGAPMLDPCNLIFFSRLIFEHSYVDANEKAKIAKTVFDVTLGYALVFRSDEDFHLCHDLLKQTMMCLKLMDEHLAELTENESVLTDLLSSKLMQTLAGKLDISNVSSLTDRQKLVLELVLKVVKI